MKKLMVIVVMCLGLSFGASAQHGHIAGPAFHSVGYVVQPRFTVGFGYYAPFYGPFGYYGFGPYWGFPYMAYPSYGVYSRPSNLQKKEEDIRLDYQDRIYSVRHDGTLTSKEKRQSVHSLKKQRDQDIHDLVANYHKQPVKE
jgi:hypothetical protein